MDELKLQPEIMLADINDGQLPITLTKRDGGYGKVVIYINGKEVQADACGPGFDTAKASQTILYNVKGSPLLIPGKENTITVNAWSADGFVESRGAETIFIPQEPERQVQPSFFAVICGVSEYSSGSIRLRYAEPDAKAVATAVKLGAEALFGKDKTFIYTLTSPGEVLPNKVNIRKTFEAIKAKAKPEDILLVYLSGHGITWGGDFGDFYYLTSDAFSASVEAYNDPAIRNQSAISTKELTEWIKTIPALKQVMIIDACGSGKAVDNLLASRDVEASQIKAIDRMKDRTGMYIISGCAADAVSYEASRYGQGLLTYSLLQAMKGAALKDDKFVDVNTLLQYARETVPQMALGIGGIQEPQLLIPKGGSFDIGLLTAVNRQQIPLSQPKPVFVRSAFLNIDASEDDLGLSAYLDEELGALSAKGANSRLVFVDAKQYPDGCKVSGTYSQVGGIWKLKYKVKCGDQEIQFELSAPNDQVLRQKLLQGVINYLK